MSFLIIFKFFHQIIVVAHHGCQRLAFFLNRLWDLAAGKTMVTLTHHKKSVRALAIHPTEYSFASGSAGGNNIKKWKCPEGAFVFNFSGHNAIINTLSVNAEGVFFSGGMVLFFLSFCTPSSFPFFFSIQTFLRGEIDRPYAN